MLIEQELSMSSDALFRCLADPRRCQILRWISSSGLLCVTELCHLTGTRQQAISHHLTILKLLRMVQLDRLGKRNYYRLTGTGRKAVQLLEFAGGPAAGSQLSRPGCLD